MPYLVPADRREVSFPHPDINESFQLVTNTSVLLWFPKT